MDGLIKLAENLLLVGKLDGANQKTMMHDLVRFRSKEHDSKTNSNSKINVGSTKNV